MFVNCTYLQSKKLFKSYLSNVFLILIKRNKLQLWEKVDCTYGLWYIDLHWGHIESTGWLYFLRSRGCWQEIENQITIDNTTSNSLCNSEMMTKLKVVFIKSTCDKGKQKR